MSVQLKRVLIIAVGLVLLGAAILWALPEVVRHVAVDQIAKRTGRAVTIGDVDLNLFTGHVAVKHFRLEEREEPEAFVEFERLDVRLFLPALLRFHVRLREIALAGPSIRVIRTGPAEFNFSDLLTGDKEPAPEPATPSRWTVTLAGRRPRGVAAGGVDGPGSGRRHHRGHDPGRRGARPARRERQDR
jgi:uncharacterized protein involved in outer membrane biogenesis